MGDLFWNGQAVEEPTLFEVEMPMSVCEKCERMVPAGETRCWIHSEVFDPVVDYLMGVEGETVQDEGLAGIVL
jgi:hypothetical protein